MSEDTGARKRASTRQLTDRDDVDDGVAEVDQGVFQQADSTTLAGRKMVKVRRGGPASSGAELPKPNISWAFTAAPAAAPAAEKDAAPAKEASPAKEAPAKEATPVKEAAPAKEATPVKEAKEATPVKEAAAKETTPVKEAAPAKETTPAKESTPAKEAPQASPAKENGEKAATPSKEEAKPEETKPPAPFSFITPPSSTFPGFPAFSFTTSNPFASAAAGSSIFGQNIAPPKPKEDGEGDGDDDDGESATIPEPEPTGAPTVLPAVPVVTGEEDENTLHQVRVNLYAIENGAYKQRGSGQLKLNRNSEGKVRLILRDQGGKHLRLNVAVLPDMEFERPSDKYVRFNCAADHTTYAIRLSLKNEATELINALTTNQPKKDSAATPTASPAKSSSS